MSNMVTRQPQKSPPAALPRSARWNAWLCAFTNPGKIGPDTAPYPVTVSAPAVSARLQQLPNALTVARLLLIPVYVALVLASTSGRSCPAAVVFGVAGVTGQLDGCLPRPRRVDVWSG